MLYRLLIDVAREDGRTFPSVRHAISTGDKMPATTLAELPGLFPNARFFNVYGCTETNDSLMQELDPRRRGPDAAPDRASAAGRRGAHPDRGRRGRRGRLAPASCSSWTPFQTQGYLKAALNEGKFADLSPRRRRRAALLPHRRHRPPPRGRVDHPRGPQRLLRQGPRRAGQHPGGRAGHPGAPRRHRGRRRRRPGRARRHPPARAGAPRAGLQAQQPVAAQAPRVEARADGDALVGRDHHGTATENINGEDRPQALRSPEREALGAWMTRPRSSSSSSRSSCPTSRSRISASDYDLLEGGVVDSLGLLKVVAWLETEFDIGVDDSRARPGELPHGRRDPRVRRQGARRGVA